MNLDPVTCLIYTTHTVMIIMHNLDMKIYTKDHVYTGSEWVITNNLYLILSQNRIRLANTKWPFAPNWQNSPNSCGNYPRYIFPPVWCSDDVPFVLRTIVGLFSLDLSFVIIQKFQFYLFFYFTAYFLDLNLNKKIKIWFAARFRTKCHSDKLSYKYSKSAL